MGTVCAWNSTTLDLDSIICVGLSSVLIRVTVSAKSRDGSPRRGPKPAFGYLIPTLKTVDGFPCSVARLRHSPSNYQP
jgi:hypothetical protein